MVSGPHLEALKLIGRNKKVLDVGCSTGYLAQAISQELNGEIDGVEIDPEAAKKAAKYINNVYVGSIEDPVLLKRLNKKYDVLLFMDVLEHVKDPLSVLVNTRRLLADNGYLIASVPNIANWRVRFGLLLGRFEYQDSGLLDRGHLRFFTLKILKRLLADSGYRIICLDYSLGAPPAVLKGVSRQNKNYLNNLFKMFTRAFPGLLANQFIIKAVKQ